MTPGPVMIVGGAEDKLKSKVILHRILQLAGGDDARIVVISTASSLGEANPKSCRPSLGPCSFSSL